MLEKPENTIEAALRLLTPFTVTRAKKIRVGNPNGDGGYVMLDMFEAGGQAFSYGIADDATFEEDLAERGLKIAMFDHTIDQLPSQHDNFVFVKQGLAGTASSDGQVDSLTNQLPHLPPSNDMLLKVDIESKEWNWLSHESTDTLGKFTQIVMELHKLHMLSDPSWRDNFSTCMGKLLRKHVIYHVHANNHREFVEIDGFKVTPVLEISLIRRDLVDYVPNQEVYPSALDRPNHGSLFDIVLDFFPFIPEGLPNHKLKQLIDDAKINALPYLDRFAAFPDIPTKGVIQPHDPSLL